jgi:N-acetylneuraminate lyase
MKNNKLEGLISAPFTPMHNDGSLNLSLIPDYCEFLKSNKVNGAFICGSTGEGVSLTMQEKKEVAQAWANATKNQNDFKTMLLLGGTCITECIDLARFASHIGIDAVSFTAPFYFKPANIKMLAECCKAIADAVPQLPFYYYHIPVLTGVDFLMIDLLKEVDELIPNFAGIKYTHEDFMDFLCCLQFKNGKYDMLWGRDENLLPALSLGATGAVGSTFNYAAPLYHQIIDAFNNGNLEKAQMLQYQSIEMIHLLGKYGGIATGKAYMKLVGFDCGSFRMPVSNMNQDQFEQFKIDVASIGFNKYCSQITAALQT